VALGHWPPMLAAPLGRPNQHAGGEPEDRSLVMATRRHRPAPQAARRQPYGRADRRHGDACRTCPIRYRRFRHLGNGRTPPRQPADQTASPLLQLPSQVRAPEAERRAGRWRGTAAAEADAWEQAFRCNLMRVPRNTPIRNLGRCRQPRQWTAIEFGLPSNSARDDRSNCLVRTATTTMYVPCSSASGLMEPASSLLPWPRWTNSKPTRKPPISKALPMPRPRPTMRRHPSRSPTSSRRRWRSSVTSLPTRSSLLAYIL
jgi:hypothetical protein